MDFQLTDEHRMVQSLAADFASREILPRAADLDHTGEFPRDIIRQAAELGLMAMMVPETYGGAGMDVLSYVIAQEELACASAGVQTIVTVNNSLVCDPILRFGTEAQKRRYLPALCNGTSLGCYCLTEPSAGSDAMSLRATAHEDGDAWVLRGTKAFVTNGVEADVCIVYARTSPEPGGRGLSAFIVEKEGKGFGPRPQGTSGARGERGAQGGRNVQGERTAQGERSAVGELNAQDERHEPKGFPGIRVGKVEKKLGIKCSSTAEIVLDDCRVPRENLLGEPGMGGRIALTTLDGGRLGIAAQAVGIARAALEESCAYARERKQFGKTIGEFQAVQWMLADMATRLDAARLLMYRAAYLRQQGLPYTKETSMAKLFASETAMWAAHKAVQIYGGYGYIADYPVERFFRDAKITEIYEGTSEIQRLVIARHLLRAA